MLEISYRNKFKKELKQQEKRGKDLEKFLEVAETLAFEKPLNPKHKNHKLVGNFKER